MADPVNAADVLRLAWQQGADLGEDEVAALLAHGGGDPVVVMPDGTLRRLSRYYPDNLLTDPVVPDA